MVDAGLVSIVLPSFNGADHIRDSIESCLNQTYKNIELIVVNDASTDGTLKIAQDYAARDTRVRIVDNQRNIKLPASLNAGFAQARGVYLTWTSDDNMYRPDAIAEMVAVLQKEKSDFVYCGYSVTDMKDNLEVTRKPEPAANIIGTNIVGACFLYTQAVKDKIGEYDTNLFCAEDYDYWSRVYRAGFKMTPHDRDLYIYRRHPKALTTTRSRQICVNTGKVVVKNVRSSGLGPRAKAAIYLDYYRRSAARTGRLFCVPYYLRYAICMLDAVAKGDKAA